MKDPLKNFNFSTIYKEYKARTCSYENYANEINDMGIDYNKINSDPGLYYYLKDKFSQKKSITIYNYIALLFWKLNTSGNFLWKQLLYDRNGKSKIDEEEKLKKIIKKLPSELKVADVEKFLDIFNYLKKENNLLPGIKTDTAWPTRSTLLHFIYPNIIPIFDQMVLKALYPNYQKGDNQKKEKFLIYINDVHGLAKKYKVKISQVRQNNDTNIRLIEMALWIIRESVI